ncbi:MAG: DUF1641 domain-containing protein [Candidatus Aminicenantes bacterium]|nr:DUF1641 domain-containing protein [Candidatus Aminicenantes bacterium]
MNQDIKQLNEKIDFLTDQITSLTNRLRAVDDFKEDMSLFAKDAFDEVVNFMSDVDFHFRSNDFLCMIKKSFRNINNFSKLLDQLQSFVEFTEDISPLAREIADDFISKLHELEQKGILESLRRSVGIVETLSENFEPEDVTNFGNSMVLAMRTIKRFTLPENLEKIEKIIEEVENYDFEKKRKVTLFSIFKKLRSKEVLRGADVMLDMAKIASKQYTK